MHATRLAALAALTLFASTACGPAVVTRRDWDAAAEEARAHAAAQAADGVAARRAAALAACAGAPLASGPASLASAVEAAPDDGRLRYEAAFLAAFVDDSDGVLRNGAAALALLPDGAPERAVALALLRGEARWAEDYEAVMTPLLATIPAVPGDPDFAEQVALARSELLRDAGDPEGAAASLREAGVPLVWRVSAPWGGYGADDLDRPFPPETEQAHGLPEVLAWVDADWPRAVRTATHTFPDGELFFPGLHGAGTGYGEARFSVAGSGPVVVQIETPAAVRLWIDGQPVLRLDTVTELAPSLARVRVDLSAGGHRLLAKVSHPEAGAWARARLWGDGAATVTVDSGSAAAPVATLTPEPGPAPLVARLEAPLPTPAAPERIYAWMARWYIAGRRPASDERVTQETARLLVAALPGSAVAWTMQAHGQGADGSVPEDVRRSRATAGFAEALRIGPDDAPTLYQLARLDRADERPQEALGRLDRALAIDPRHPGALALRLSILADLGWRAESEAAYGALVSTPLSDGSVRLALAFDQSLGRWDDAQRLVGRWRERAPGAASEAAASLAWARGDYGAAGEGLAAWRAGGPSLDRPFRFQAELLRIAGRAAEERALLDAWCARSPDDVWARRRLAQRLFLDGDQAGAVAVWSRLLEDRPSAVDVNAVVSALQDRPIVDSPVDTAADWIAAYEKARQSIPALAAWDEAPGVQILSGSDIRVMTDGTTVQVERVIRRMQSRELADASGELPVPDDAVLLEARTLRADGTVREPEVDQGKGALSFSGLRPGDYTELRLLRVVPSARRTGGGIGACTAGSWGLPIFALRCTLSAPDGVPITVTSRNGMPAPFANRGGGEALWAWSLDALPAVPPEPFAAPPAEFVPHAFFRFGSAERASDAWERIWRSLRGGYGPRLRPSPELLRIAAGLAQHRSSLDAARAAYLFVRDEVTAADSPPRFSTSAAATLAARKGAPPLLLTALLRAQGLAPDLLLCHALDDALVADPQPTPTVYTRPLVRVAVDGRTLWLDLEDRFTPFGDVAPALLGAECLAVVGPAADALAAARVRVPEDAGGPEGWDFDLRLALDDRGGATGTLRATGEGLAPAQVRRVLGAVKDAERRALVEEWLRRSLPGVRLGSLTFDGLDSAERPLLIDADFSTENLFERRDGALVATAVVPDPLSHYLTGSAAPEDYVRLPRRQTPLALRFLAERLTLRLTPPPGGRIETAPEAADVDGAGLHFAQTVEREGAAVVVRRETRVSLVRVPLADFVTLGRAVGVIHQATNATVRVSLAGAR